MQLLERVSIKKNVLRVIRNRMKAEVKETHIVSTLKIRVILNKEKKQVEENELQIALINEKAQQLSQIQVIQIILIS